jgi:hypothetical protein
MHSLRHGIGDNALDPDGSQENLNAREEANSIVQ